MIKGKEQMFYHKKNLGANSFSQRYQELHQVLLTATSHASPDALTGHTQSTTKHTNPNRLNASKVSIHIIRNVD